MLKKLLVICFSVLIQAFALSAEAATINWSATISVPSNGPANPVADMKFYASAPAVPLSPSYGVSDFDIASSWAPLRCKVVNGTPWVTLEILQTSWPYSIPSSVTCSKVINGDTHNLSISVTTFNRDWSNGVLPSWTQGFSFSLPMDHSFGTWKVLPTGYTYANQNTTLTKSGGMPWNKTKCFVKYHANQYWLWVSAGYITEAGYGFCRVNRNGSNWDIPVSVSRYFALQSEEVSKESVFEDSLN